MLQNIFHALKGLFENIPKLFDWLNTPSMLDFSQYYENGQAHFNPSANIVQALITGQYTKVSPLTFITTNIVSVIAVLVLVYIIARILDAIPIA